MTDLFQHVGCVTKEDDYKTFLDKIRKGLQSKTNAVVQWNFLFANFSTRYKVFRGLFKRDFQCSQIDHFRRLRLETAS